jgi:hypothetical protein
MIVNKIAKTGRFDSDNTEKHQSPRGFAALANAGHYPRLLFAKKSQCRKEGVCNRVFFLEALANARDFKYTARAGLEEPANSCLAVRPNHFV